MIGLGVAAASAKLAVTHGPAARRGSVVLSAAISIGASSRAEFLDRVRKADKPRVVTYGNETPPRLRAEIEALGDLPNVRVERLPKGKLSIHEEFPDSVAPAIKSFPQR
jgi:pimeloyl-ACP methyl ester carboxylesterase